MYLYVGHLLVGLRRLGNSVRTYVHCSCSVVWCLEVVTPVPQAFMPPIMYTCYLGRTFLQHHQQACSDPDVCDVTVALSMECQRSFRNVSFVEMRDITHDDTVISAHQLDVKVRGSNPTTMLLFSVRSRIHGMVH